MMASYRLYIVCVALCTVHSVLSLSIKGRIRHNNYVLSEVQVSNYVDGENWSNTRDFTLDRLEGADTLPTLTVANFKVNHALKLTNIALEHFPVFENTTFTEIHISRNKFKHVPTNALSAPQPLNLYLNNNEIRSMADKSVNKHALIVVLSCNKLGNFSQSWFEDPSSIEILNLDSNRIEYIQDRAFNQMTKLTQLYVNYNHLTSIGNEAFGSPITFLQLHFVGIAQLTTDMFADRDMPMEFLDIHHNQLSYLPEALLLKLKLKSISLVGNPWQCQCLRDLERWLRELNASRWDIYSRRDEPVCVVPRNFAQACIPVVDSELQETYARGLSPVQGCWGNPCNCTNWQPRLGQLT